MVKGGDAPSSPGASLKYLRIPSQHSSETPSSGLADDVDIKFNPSQG